MGAPWTETLILWTPVSVGWSTTEEGTIVICQHKLLKARWCRYDAMEQVCLVDLRPNCTQMLYVD